MDLTTVRPTTKKPTTVVPRTTIPLTELPNTILPTMGELQTVVPKTKVPHVSNMPLYEFNYNRTNQQVSPFSDYNDPTQINSFADVIWNTLSKNDKLKTRDYGILSDIGDSDNLLLSPFAMGARAITGAMDLMLNTVVEPIKQGNFAALGLNTLVNFGESMDILASPIKGLVMDGPEGLIKGSIGRVNYDVDTGNWLLDMAGELLLDPFNWISFGAAGIAKGAAATASKEVLESSIDIATKKGIKVLASELSPTESLTKMFKNYASANFMQNGGDISKAVMGTINQLGGDKVFSREFIDIVQKQQLQSVAETQVRNLAIAKGLANTVRVADNAEKVLAEGSAFLALIPAKTLKNLISKTPAWEYVAEHVAKIIYDSYVKVTGLEDTFNLINYHIVKNSTPIIEDHITHVLSRVGLDTIDTIDIDKMVTDRALDNIANLNKLLDSEDMISNKMFIAEVLTEVSGNRVLLEEVKKVIRENPDLSLDEILKSIGTSRTTILTDINDIFAHNLSILDEINAKNKGVFQSVKTEYVAMTYRLSSTLQKYTNLELFEDTINKTILDTIANKELLSPDELQKQIDVIKDLIKNKKYVEASIQNKTTKIPTVTDMDTFKALKNNTQVAITESPKPLDENPFAFKNINTTKYFKTPKDLDTNVQGFLKNTFNSTFTIDNLKSTIQLFNNPKLLEIPNLKDSYLRINPALKTLVQFTELLNKGTNPFELSFYRNTFINAIKDLQREFQAITGFAPELITPEIKELITAISSIKTYGVAEALLRADSFTVMYRTKWEELHMLTQSFEPRQILNAQGQLVNVDLKESLEAFNNNQQIISQLESFININDEDISGVAYSTKAVIKNLTSIYSFIKNVYNDPYISTELKNFYISSLMKNKNIHGASVLLNPEMLHKKVMKDFETFVNSAQTVRKLNLNALLTDTNNLLKKQDKKILDNFNKLSEVDKAFFNKLVASGETHTALEDAHLAEIIIRLRCPDDYIADFIDGIPVNKAGKYIYISDIEATGLSANNSFVTEIGLKQMGTDQTISYRLAYLPETHDVSEEILKSKYPGLSTEEALEQYKKFYDPANLDNAGVTFFTSESDMLQAYKDHLNTLDVGSDIIFHNGKAYDTPMLMDRGLTYGINFINSPIYKAKDSLYDMRKLNFGYSVSQIEEISLWNHIKQYINQLDIDDISLSFLNPLSQHNMEVLSKMINIASGGPNNAYRKPLINSLEKIKTDLNNLHTELIDANKYDTVFSKELLNTPQAQQTFIKQCQAKYLQNQEILNNIEKYYTNPIQAAVEKESLLRQQQGLSETLRLADVDSAGNINGFINMNLVRMFYGYNMDNLPIQGYEKIVDKQLILNYLDIPDDLLIPITNQYGKDGFSWESLYDFVRDFPSAYKSLTNSVTAIQNKELIQNNIIKLKQILANQNDMYKFVKDNNIDARANYLIAEKLFARANEFKLDTSILDKEFVNIMQEYEESKFKYSAEELMKKQINLVENGIDNPDLKVQAWRELLEEDLTTIDKYSTNILKKLSTDKTYTGFTNTRTQVLLTLASEVQKPFDLVKAYMDNLNPTEKIKFVSAFKRGDNKNQYKAVRQLLEQTPEDLLATLYTKSMVIVYDKNFVNSFDGGEFTQQLLSRTKELSDKGIKLIEEDNVIYVVPSKDNIFKCIVDPVSNNTIYELNGNTIEIPTLNEIVVAESMRGQIPDNIVDGLNKAQESMIRITDGNATGSLYEVTNTSWYKTLYDKLPTVVQNELGDISLYTNPALFNGRSRYNLSVFGSYETRTRFSDFSTSSFIKNYTNTFKTVGKNATGKCHYVDFILNSGTSVNYGVIGEQLRAGNYADVIKTFEDAPESVLGALVYNKSGEVRLIEIKPTSKANLIRAQKLDAKILDYHVFSTAFNVINTSTFSDSNPVLEVYTKLLRTFKLGYLTSTGYLLRNIIDTFGKNLIEAKGNVIATAKYTYNAMKMYTEYDKIILDIINTNPNKVLSKTSIKEYFETMNPSMSYEDWSFIHDILNEGAFVGQVQSLELYHGFRRSIKNQEIPDEELQGLFETYQHAKKSLNPVDNLMGLNSNIEDIQRLASYLMMRENGMNFAESVAKTAFNHFDYSIKTDFQKAMELVMPFYTFRMKNIHYWVNIIAENGWLAGALRDVMTPIWDFDDIEYYELQHNQSLQSRILSGNVQILDSGVTFKLNPSVSDAIKFATDPFGEMYNSLFTPIQSLIEAGLTLTPDIAVKKGVMNVFNIYEPNHKNEFDKVYELLNFVPFGSTVQRFMMGYKYAQETNNVLPMIAPSIFGRVKRFKPYNYTSYNRYNRYGSNYSKYKKIAKPRKSYPKKRYNKYTPKYYPINFTNIYIDGMYSIPNISTYTAQANRYYHFSRLPKIPRVNIYNKLYNTRGKPRWDAMLQPVSSQNLKYVIKNTIHYK